LVNKTARRAAYEALLRCFKNGSWSAQTLDYLIRDYALSTQDAALATRITLGVIQNSVYCDYIIGQFSSIPVEKLQPGVKVILEMAVYQVRLMDKIPVHAAVSEAVQLCKETGNARASGYVNAMLRSLASCAPEKLAVPGEGTAEHLSVKYSHPLWMVERILAEHGYAFTEAFLKANNSPAPLYIQINTLETTVDAYTTLLREAGVEYEETSCSGCLKLKGGNVTALPGFAEGLFYVQDIAARIAAEISGVKPGDKVLDVCSAPGGKSFAAAIRMLGKGTITSCDIHDKKLSLVRAGAERIGIGIITTQAADGRVEKPDYVGAFDVVITDVPCSGLGVIAGKPEIRFKQEAEIAALPVIQADILRNAAGYVKMGGVLVYSTCTVLPEENENIVKRFIAENPAYALEPIQCCGVVQEEGMYTFWPHIDGSSGFFVAKIRRSLE